MRTFIVWRAAWTLFITSPIELPKTKRRFVMPWGWFKWLLLVSKTLMFCRLLWDVFIQWLRPKGKQSWITNERAKTEYKRCNKDRLASILRKDRAVHPFHVQLYHLQSMAVFPKGSKGAHMVLPPDSAQADTQHPQFRMTLAVTQDAYMLT